MNTPDARYVNKRLSEYILIRSKIAKILSEPMHCRRNNSLNHKIVLGRETTPVKSTIINYMLMQCTT